MSGNFHNKGRTFLSAKLHLRLRTRLVVLAALFLLGNTMPAAPVSAAPAADEIVFQLQVSEIPNPICVRSIYHVTVTPVVNRTTIVNGPTIRLRGNPALSDVSITTTISDPSVISLKSAEGRLSGLDAAIGNGSVLFTVRAEKAGQSTLSFSGWVRDARQEQIFQIQEKNIKVVDCKYELTMQFHWSTSGAAFNGFSSGYLHTELTPREEDYVYIGDDSFEFLNGVTFPSLSGETCIANLSGYHNQTHIEGRLIDDELRLQFFYQPGTSFIDVQCSDPWLGTSSSSGSAIFDPTRTGVKEWNIPPRGAERVFDIEAPMPPNGKLLIKVKQIVE